MRLLSIALCAIQFSSLGATMVIAQESSYDENALRVESRLGDLQILRGTSSTVVARAGIFRGPKVASLVSLSDSALAEAKVFEHNYDPGIYMVSAGIALFGAAIGIGRIPDLNNGIPGGMLASGVLLIAFGGSKLESAYRGLSKAIWWYNRDLKR